MRKALRSKQAFILALALGGGFAGVIRVAAADLPKMGDENTVQITVHVSNRVHMPADMLAETEFVTTQILQQVRVQVVWLDCTITGANAELPPACDRRLKQTDLLLDFVYEIRSLSPNMKEETLGFALVPGNGEQGNLAYISLQRAHFAARECATSLEIILGLAVAHEIGHLLMGSGEHARSGVMRARWDVKDLILAAKGDLRFTSNEVKKLHDGAVARMAAARYFPKPKGTTCGEMVRIERHDADRSR